jgi:hypothetical protein
VNSGKAGLLRMTGDLGIVRPLNNQLQDNCRMTSPAGKPE